MCDQLRYELLFVRFFLPSLQEASLCSEVNLCDIVVSYDILHAFCGHVAEMDNSVGRRLKEPSRVSLMRIESVLRGVIRLCVRVCDTLWFQKSFVFSRFVPSSPKVRSREVTSLALLLYVRASCNRSKYAQLDQDIRDDSHKK